MKTCILFGLISLTLLQCTSHEQQMDQLVQQKLEAQRLQLIADKEQACTQQINSILDHYADSILVVLSKKIKYDSLTIPHDTLRPEKPEIEFPEYQKPEKPD